MGLAGGQKQDEEEKVREGLRVMKVAEEEAEVRIKEIEEGGLRGAMLLLQAGMSQQDQLPPRVILQEGDRIIDG